MTGSTGRDTKPRDPPYVVIAPEVARLASEGLARNEIARRLKRAPSTVTRAADHAGVEFDSGSTATATKAASEQATARRAELAELTADIALLAGRRLRMEVGAELLDPANVRALATAMGVSVDKALLLAATIPEMSDDGMSVAREFMQAIDTDALEGTYGPDDRDEEEAATGRPQIEYRPQLLGDNS